MKDNSKVAKQVRKEISENFAQNLIDELCHVPITKRIKGELAKKFLDYCDKMEIELTERLIEEIYKCDKCDDTGVYTKVIDKGSHFGGGLNEDHVEYFCDCEKGEEMRNGGYKL